MMEGDDINEHFYTAGGAVHPSLPPLNIMMHQQQQQQQQPQQVQIVQQQHQHENQKNTFTQHQNKTIPANIYSVYPSVQALEVISNLLQDTCSYLEILSNDLEEGKKRPATKKGNKSVGVANSEEGDSGMKTSLQLPCDCLHLIINNLNEHTSIIGRAISNTSQTKEVRLAQRKLLKRKQTQTGDYLSQKNSGIIMGRDPRGVLSMSMQSSQVALGDILSQTNPEFIKKQGSKKRKNDTTDLVSEAAKKKQKADSETIEEGMVDGESKEDSILNDMIFLPIPMEGKFQYSPMEAVAYISHLVENPSCDKCYVKAYKNKIIGRNLVPVKNSQLNSVVKQYGGNGNPLAPM